MSKVKRAGKGLAAALILFFAFSFIGAVLLKFTAFPEKWGFFYVLGCLIVSSFIFAYYLSSCLQKAGILCGLFGGAGLLLIILFLISAYFGEKITPGTFSPFYLIPIAAGILGGIFGANARKA